MFVFKKQALSNTKFPAKKQTKASLTGRQGLTEPERKLSGSVRKRREHLGFFVEKIGDCLVITPEYLVSPSMVPGMG